ncbi:hypothetical protein AOLI_G00041210 [Acnodon oligacanthus]
MLSPGQKGPLSARPASAPRVDYVHFGDTSEESSPFPGRSSSQCRHINASVSTSAPFPLQRLQDSGTIMRSAFYIITNRLFMAAGFSIQDLGNLLGPPLTALVTLVAALFAARWIPSVVKVEAFIIQSVACLCRVMLGGSRATVSRPVSQRAPYSPRLSISTPAAQVSSPPDIVSYSDWEQALMSPMPSPDVL